MTAPRIPRTPDSDSGFGTDPDSRTPMKPGDAATAILVLCLGCLVVVALVALALTFGAHVRSEVDAIFAAEEAAKESPK